MNLMTTVMRGDDDRILIYICCNTSLPSIITSSILQVSLMMILEQTSIA
jgi:hypothetical protein